MTILKGSIIDQRDMMFFASTLCGTLLVIAVVGKTCGYSVVHTNGRAVGVGASADHQVDATNSALLVKDIFGMGAVSKNEEDKI